MASPVQLNQVLTNLLVNAAQAMRAGPGRLDVRVESLEVEQPYADPDLALARGRYVRLTVSDSGQGMDAATQRQIFDPFFTTKRNGTGLGLAVVQRIVKDHGACIRVSSEPGRGTSFRLYFIAPPEASAASQAA
jgi:two-component system, cell cycle sensor histidine kinase and response regulator CckA